MLAVLERKYQDILAENEQNHRRLAEQQQHYSATLQAEIRRQTEELRTAMGAAEAANTAKSAFLATTAEIRTPMNAILGFTDLLLETGLDSEQHAFARTIRTSGDALLTLPQRPPRFLQDRGRPAGPRTGSSLPRRPSPARSAP